MNNNLKQRLKKAQDSTIEWANSEQAENLVQKVSTLLQRLLSWIKNHPKTTAGIVAAALIFSLFNRESKVDMLKVHDFDLVASDPQDPLRVAKGVPLADIIPATAIALGEKSVKKHPEHPRLHYQLGRVYTHSGHHDKAFASYKKAAELDYPIAKVRLATAYASGTGTKANLAKAKSLFDSAAKAGSKLATREKNKFFFSEKGFAYPKDFLAIYTGNFDQTVTPKGDLIIHLYNFVSTMQKIEGCPQLLSNEGALALGQKGTSVGFGQVLGMIAGSRRANPTSTGRSIDYAGAFQQGVNEGQAVARQAMSQQSAAENDTAIFWTRYGARTPVARRMFAQMDRFVRGVEGVGFMSELEKNMSGR